MKSLRLVKNIVLIRLLTSIIITAFVLQNTAWPSNYKLYSSQSTLAPESLLRYFGKKGPSDISIYEILHIWNRLANIQRVIEENQGDSISKLRGKVMATDISGEESLRRNLYFGGYHIHKYKDGIFYIDIKMVGENREMYKRRVYFFRKGAKLNQGFRDQVGIGEKENRIKYAKKRGFWICDLEKNRADETPGMTRRNFMLSSALAGAFLWLKTKISYAESPRQSGTKIKKETDGHWLYINGERSSGLPGVCYQPITDPNEDWSDYFYKPEGEENWARLYAALLDSNDPLLKESGFEGMSGRGHAEIMSAMGIESIRIYGVTLYTQEDIERVKKIFGRIYEQYGIMVLIGDFAGLYTHANDWEANERDLRLLVRNYCNEPWLLGYQLGNENNYFLRGGIFASQTNTPIDLDLAGYYGKMDEMAKALKDEMRKQGREHIVVLGNGDLKREEALEIKKMKHIDALGLNVYRNTEGVMELLKMIYDELGLPVMFSEFGRQSTDEGGGDAQARYIQDIWNTLSANMAGRKGYGNVLAGFVFEFTDEPWKTDSHFGILNKLAEEKLDLRTDNNPFMVGETDPGYDKGLFTNEVKVVVLRNAYQNSGKIKQYRWDGDRVVAERNTGRILDGGNAEFVSVQISDYEQELFTNIFSKLEDKNLILVFVEGLNLLNYETLNLYQVARASTTRNQIYIPGNFLYLLNLSAHPEWVLEYIVTYESIRKEDNGRLLNAPVSIIRTETLRRLGEDKQNAFIDILQLSAAIEYIGQGIYESVGEKDQDFLLHLDKDGCLQIKGTKDNALIFSLDSDFIKGFGTVQDYELRLTYWDKLQARLQGRKDTSLEMIPKGLGLDEIRGLLIQILLRREMVSKDAALEERNLDELGKSIPNGLEQKKRISISSKHLIDNIVKLNKEGRKYKYTQINTGIKCLLERIYAGFSIEIINESGIENKELLDLISTIFDVGNYFRDNRMSVKSASILKADDYYEDGILLLHKDSDNEQLKVLKSNKRVKYIDGERGISVNVLISVGIYKLLGKSESEMKELLLNLGYTEDQITQMNLKDLFILPPITSVLALINDIASFRRTIDLSA